MFVGRLLSPFSLKASGPKGDDQNLKKLKRLGALISSVRLSLTLLLVKSGFG
jgi:hypothetical protein